MTIAYAREDDLGRDEFVAVLEASGLAERRPVGEPGRIDAMLAYANVIVTARDGGRLVGIARGLSDFSYCFYLSDLAVDQAFQGRGIGRALIARSHEEAGLDTTLILIAAPKAASYYPHIGLTPGEGCWIVPRRS